MGELEATADRQAIWSATANGLKGTLDFARRLTFALSILGALLATIASQLNDKPRLYLAIFGAVLLAVVSFLSSRLLDQGRVTRWLRARVASEALKREAFKYAASASPYDDAVTRDSLLNEQRERIEKDVDDLLGEALPATGSGSAPRAPLARGDYIEKRALYQVKKFYEPKAETSRRSAQTLRWTEFLLSLAATILTAVVGVAGKTPFGIPFDFVALTAVLTTIAGAVLTHIEASRYDFLATTYRAAARRLGNELAKVKDSATLSAADWSAFVQRCESIIADENSNWIAKWSNPNR